MERAYHLGLAVRKEAHAARRQTQSALKQVRVTSPTLASLSFFGVSQHGRHAVAGRVAISRRNEFAEHGGPVDESACGKNCRRQVTRARRVVEKDLGCWQLPWGQQYDRTTPVGPHKRTGPLYMDMAPRRGLSQMRTPKE